MKNISMHGDKNLGDIVYNIKAIYISFTLLEILIESQERFMVMQLDLKKKIVV